MDNNSNVDYLIIADIIENIFGKFRKHNEYRYQISIDCPVCSEEIKGLTSGDGKGNLEINYKKNIFKCWSCSDTHQTHGSLYKLIKKYGDTKSLKKYVMYRPDDNGDIELKNYKPIFLPKEFVNFNKVSLGLKLTPHYKQAFNYIQSRNITSEMIDKFNIGFCYKGKYEHRIIIPSYDEYDDLNYFIARSYLTNTKYKFQNPEAEKESIIWNESLIDWHEDIYIVEGVFDSIFIENSIPLLGKFMSSHLHHKLYNQAKKNVIIILDPDAKDQAELLYHKLNCGKLMGRVFIVQLEGDKDVADLKGEINDYRIKQLD